MQGGVIGGICLLTFLLSKGRAEELETSRGLTDGEDVKQTPSDLKSGSASKAGSQSNDDGFSAAPFNPFNEELGPYTPPGSGRGNSNNPELNSYPYYSSYPYSPGLNAMQAQPELNNRIYQPGYSGSPNLSPYNQGSGLPQLSAQGNRESYQRMLEPSSVNSKPDSRMSPGSELSYFSSSYPYTRGLGSDQKESLDNSAPYQAVPLPDPNYSKYDRLTVPYIEPKSTQIRTDSKTYQAAISRYDSRLNQGQHFAHSLYHTHEKDQYQAFPMLSDNNSKANEFSLVPYKDPNSLLSKLSSKQEEPISKQYGDGSDTASLLSSSYSYALRTNPNQEDMNSYQSIPMPDRESTLRESNSYNGKEIEENEARQFIPSIYEMKSDPLSSSYPNAGISNESNPEIDDPDSSSDLESKSGLHLYKFHTRPLQLAYPRLYPSGAETAQAYAAVRPASSAVPYRYTPGQRTYAIDYPSESPYRAWPLNEPRPSPPNVFNNGQSSPIAFEDAKSRVIYPYEYVFPNKMPGGENVIQCTKENEFHHFWSKGQDCLVCICLNEYGVLTPVCASCGGCHNPPPALPEPIPQLPESITVQPASPAPSEPVPIVPEPQPGVPIGPELEPVPTPAPYPVYPESIASPSPGPELVPEPIPTLPTPPPGASCAPLPSGEPFPNPLHPCQICVCKESSVSGKPDVQIECKENPQCIAPADVTTLPPIPDVAMPIPLPVCEKFPENVLFPHPTESCKLCKCAKSVSENGLPEQQITCYPHPDCIPKLEPITESAPPLPIPIEPLKTKPVPEPGPEPIQPEKEPFMPVEPVPLPEIVTAEPLPWPPITTVTPITTPGPPSPALTPRPGPLPGPSPHESCLPYPPNQTFQHPWDECQICQCTEAVTSGLTNVEVNCYTKPSCCIEPPDAVKKALPGFNLPFPSLTNAADSPDILALPPGPQTGVITSTYRPPSTYISYTPRPVSLYPNNKPVVDALSQPTGYSSQSYPRIPETGFGDPTSSYPYQPNYPSPYVNPQYPDYPPRLPQPANTYKPSSYAYPPNYQYTQGDGVGNNYPPQSRYKYDPRFTVVSSPNVYPPLYGYDIPPVYPPGQGIEGYSQPQASAPTALKTPSLAPSYGPTVARTKSGNVAAEDQDET